MIEDAKKVRTEAELRAFFTKDLSEISNNRGQGTIYAVDYDNDSEVNEVERIFAHRDMRVERNEIPIILPEEDAKRHQKNPLPFIQRRIEMRAPPVSTIVPKNPTNVQDDSMSKDVSF